MFLDWGDGWVAVNDHDNDVAALDGFSIQWGTDGIDQQPDPSVMTFRLRDSTGWLTGRALTLAGARVLVQISAQPTWGMLRDDMGAWSAQRMRLDAMHQAYTPDNPSGYTPPVAELETLAKALPDTCLLVLDEAYMDFTDDEADYSLAKRLDEFPNVIISRTFSKSFGMAGLRLGYAIVPEELADHYWRVRLPFSVNLMAEEAGITALQDVAFHDETVRVVREGRAWLTGELTKLGCRVFPSQSNFLMFELPADGPNAASLFEDLLRRGIILRPLTSYGLPRNLRVSVGTAEENTMLINAMRELL